MCVLAKRKEQAAKRRQWYQPGDGKRQPQGATANMRVLRGSTGESSCDSLDEDTLSIAADGPPAGSLEPSPAHARESPRRSEGKPIVHHVLHGGPEPVAQAHRRRVPETGGEGTLTQEHL